MGMAPPLLVVTPTKGHVGWDEPVRDPPLSFKKKACLTVTEANGLPGNEPE
ncbi:hypothetical protein GCM10009504_40640 [Pseudomonas laurentiana]|nr:hypothetical protein GCM10009504_40640 [Pseudomonas laurentiana]